MNTLKDIVGLIEKVADLVSDLQKVVEKNQKRIQELERKRTW